MPWVINNDHKIEELSSIVLFDPVIKIVLTGKSNTSVSAETNFLNKTKQKRESMTK